MRTETAASGGIGLGRGGRLSRQRKRDAVLRLLRGEDLETLSRALGVTAATLTGWQDTFLVLLCHEVLEAAGTSGKASGESVCQVEAQGCDRGLNVALRSEGERPGDGSSREGEVPGGSPSVDLRGEPGLAARPEIHTPRCTGRHDGGTRASPAPRSGPAPSPA